MMATSACWCATQEQTDEVPHPHDTQWGCPVLAVPQNRTIYLAPALSPRALLPEDKQRAISDLIKWWTSQAEKDAQTTVPKAIEYGSADLIEIGRAMARAARRPNLTDAQAAELGIYFYVVGKLGRWTAAVEEGRPVSDDTLFDISVYITMVRRVRATGGWPYATEGEPE